MYHNRSEERVKVAMEILKADPTLSDWAVRKKACDIRVDLRNIDLQVARVRLTRCPEEEKCNCESAAAPTNGELSTGDLEHKLMALAKEVGIEAVRQAATRLAV